MEIAFRIPLFCKSKKKTYSRHSLNSHFSQLLRYFESFVSKATNIFYMKRFVVFETRQRDLSIHVL